MNFHHVVLVGLSGSGKSTIGPRLARRLDLLFIDTDKTVVARAGCPIDEIFATRGEATFRAFEREAVREAIAGPRSVIATGGGAPVDPENFRQLWEGNAVIWLDAPMEVLISRMEGSQRAGREKRPLLANGGARLRLPALLEARAPIYSQAHVRVETGVVRPEVVVTEIIRQVRPGQTRTRSTSRGNAAASASPPANTPSKYASLRRGKGGSVGRAHG